jgi:cell division septal protein FtsQ
MKTRRSRRVPPPMARRRKETKRVSRKVWLMPAGAATALLGLLAVVFLTGIFDVHEISVHGSRNLPLETLRGKTQEWVGANAFTIPLSDIRDALQSDPAVGEVTFRRRLPHRLDCYIREREPVALLNLDKIAEVDAGGTVIPAAGRSMNIDLPVITGLRNSDLEKDSGRQRIGKALRVLELLKEFGFSPAEQLSEINVDDGEVVLVWMDSGTLVKVGRDGYEDRIRKFRAVYPSLREQGGLPDLIDLRFDRQVIVR